MSTSNRGLEFFLFYWLISSRNDPRSNTDPVPGIDRHHRQCKVSDFLFRKLCLYLFKNFVGNVPFSDLRDRFRPSQRGPFAVAIKRRFSPGVERVQPLVGFANGLQVLPMHVEAKRTAVDLRSP